MRDQSFDKSDNGSCFRQFRPISDNSFIEERSPQLIATSRFKNLLDINSELEKEMDFDQDGEPCQEQSVIEV